VIFGQLNPQKQVFERGQKAVCNVFVERHPASQSLPSDNSRAEYDIVNSEGDHAGHGSNQQRRVLVIGMKHDDYVRALRQCFAVAGLLVASITVVPVVDEAL
jgi:hypothetical protein